MRFTMDNNSMKQFPDLMAGRKIMYVHGFGSSAQSGTVTRIRQALPKADVVAYDLPVEPHEALQLLRQRCCDEQPDLIIGTSMGGMYAEQLYGFGRILVNPAFRIADTMREHGLTGKQTFFSPRQDGVQEFFVDKPLVKAYREVSEQCFSGAADEGEQERVWALFGDKDDLVDTWDLYSDHYRHAIRFHGGHRMDDHSFMHAVVPVIRRISDRLSDVQRPIIYIGIETMRDAFGKPLSSMLKAIYMLIEHYHVYFVAPNPSHRHGQTAEVQAWLEQEVSTPAYNRVVFTNQRHLLYGDYLIARQPDKEFMGTGIAFGSDEFKTWETIITYFERLGGQ